MRPTQRNEKELSERTALFFARRKGVHYFPRTARRDMPPAGGRGKGAILFRKREWPLWNPKRKALIGSLDFERLLCLRNENTCARQSRVSTARRFASASIIRCCAAVGGSAALRMRHTPCGCRSADLVEVRSNQRLPPVSSMRRAQQCRIRQAVCRRANVTRASR